MLTNCLAECAHLTITISEIERYIGRKSSFFIPLCIRRPHWGRGRFPSEYRHPVWYGKARIVWLSDGEKNFGDIFIRFGATHERDGQTDGYRVTAIAALCIASHGNNNKCIGDDTKAAARRSLNCIKKQNKIKYGEKRFSIWRMEFLHPAM